MGYFNNNNEKVLTQYDKDKIMAREIIGKWGEKVKLYNSDIKENNGYYNEYIYYNNGLELVYSELEGLFIIYNEEKVLGNKNIFENDDLEGTQIYVPGNWEQKLNEIYCLATKSNKVVSAESSYERGIEVLRLLDLVGSCRINDNIRIIRDDIRLTNDKNNLNITYSVYCDDELVFSGSYVSSNREKIYVYEPGEWEEDIKMYIKVLSIERENLIQEQKAKKLILNK